MRRLLVVFAVLVAAACTPPASPTGCEADACEAGPVDAALGDASVTASS